MYSVSAFRWSKNSTASWRLTRCGVPPVGTARRALLIGSKAAKPTFANGKWKRPELSLRKLNILKKHHKILGVPWQDPPSMEKTAKPLVQVHMAGRKHDRTKAIRIQQTKTLLEGQLKQWAQHNKTRRDKLKDKVEWDPFMELFPKGFEKFPPPPVEDVEATKLYNLRMEARLRKEKRWAEMLKGAETKKKVSREERLAKKEEEKIARKGAKKEGKKPAAAAAAGTGVTKGGKPVPGKPGKQVKKKSKEAQAKAKEDKVKLEYRKMKAKKREKK